jgi:DNA uptake protein ComE-like DNA-binding protein
MLPLKSYFIFSKSHRVGIVLLLLLIVIAQLCYFIVSNQKATINEDTHWLLAQNEIDSIKQQIANKKDTIYPFNPNFISDYKGYKLGMSIQEIDRLHQYRAQNKYVNSAAEFQKVTLVSNAVLEKISPYFKFPEWVSAKQEKSNKTFQFFAPREKKEVIVKDINLATKEDLIAVYGIGEKLADKILIEKEKFGGFVSMEQFQFIWGISPEAIQDLQKRFVVKNTNSIIKIAINDLSIKELSKFPYFNYSLAKEIVIYRTMNNGIKEIADLTKIKGMPNEKIKIIALYLEF